MLVDELGVPVSNEQKRIAVEPGRGALEPNAVGQKDRDRHIVLAHSQNNTDAIVGAVSADRKRLYLADDNRPMQGEVRGPDQMEICRSLAEPDRMRAFCRIFERRR